MVKESLTMQTQKTRREIISHNWGVGQFHPLEVLLNSGSGQLEEIHFFSGSTNTLQEVCSWSILPKPHNRNSNNSMFLSKMDEVISCLAHWVFKI